MTAMAGFGDVLNWTRQQVTSRVPKADLDQRDPDYIREQLPGLWLLASLYFRADVRGLERIPKDGPVLLVGNHSGGNLPPDTFVFTLAFCSYFGVERPFYQLAHNLVVSMPGLGSLRKFGTVAANHENAELALDSGAALLVYPGGDYEVFRPFVAASRGGLRWPQGIRQAGSRGRRADRAHRQRRWAGGGAVPRPRAVAGQAADGRQVGTAEERADSAGAAVGSHRQRYGAAAAAADEDRDRGAGPDRRRRHRGQRRRRRARQSGGRLQAGVDRLAAGRRFPVLG